MRTYTMLKLRRIMIATFFATWIFTRHNIKAGSNVKAASASEFKPVEVRLGAIKYMAVYLLDWT
jgi:hypothetical protein